MTLIEVASLLNKEATMEIKRKDGMLIGSFNVGAFNKAQYFGNDLDRRYLGFISSLKISKIDAVDNHHLAFIVDVTEYAIEIIKKFKKEYEKQ